MKANIIIITAITILGVSCKDHPQETPAAQHAATSSAADSTLVELSADQLKNAGLTTGMPETREMHTTLKVNGVIDVPPANIISVSIPLGGYLKKMSLIPGEKISRGSILATLEDPQYIQLQQDYLMAKSKLSYAEADYNRQKGLNETKSTSDKVFQQAKNSYEEQKILLKSLAEKLRLININPETLNEDNISRSVNIYAPISGYVTKVNVNIGKYVNPSDVLFELINPDDLHVRLTVFENDASRLSVGQKIICSTNSKPDEKYVATIHLITPNIEQDRATEVHCHLEKHGVKLLPGTFMNAEIQLNNARVLAVPEDAVVKWNNGYYIFIAEADHQFRITPVQTGVTNSGYVEIRSSLPQKNIVTKNAYTLLMKMKNSGEEE